MNDVQLVALYVVAIGHNGTPSGHLYAKTMSDGVDLDKHTKLLGVLKKVGWVEENGYYLTLTEKGKVKHDEIALALFSK